MSFTDLVDAPALGAFQPSREQARAAERESKRLRKDPHRRRKYLSHVRSDPSVIRGAIATLEALLQHSDDLAKPVWPSQKALARLAHVSVRTVQRHLQELREAGYLLVYVYAADRDGSGRYRRRKTKRYYFTFAKSPGRGRRVRRNRSSYLDDTDDVTNLLGNSNHRPSGAGGGGIGLVIEGLRTALGSRRAKSPPPAPPSPPPPGSWSDQTGCIACASGWVLDKSGAASRCTCS